MSTPMEKDDDDIATSTNNTSAQERRALIAAIRLLKRNNLLQTVETISREAKIALEDIEVVDDEDLASLIHAKLEIHPSSTSTSKPDPTSETDAIGSNSVLNETDAIGSDSVLYEVAFAELQNFIDKSFDIYKPELSTVLYPILTQLYLKLVASGQTRQGRELVEKYGPELSYFYRQDLQNLLTITKPQDIENNDFVFVTEKRKFVIRMSRASHLLFTQHIQDSKQKVISDIVAKYLHFDTYEGTPRSKAQCDATAGSLIGEAKHQDNQKRVYYRLLKEVDFLASAPEEEDDNDPDGIYKPKRKKPKRSHSFSKKSKSNPNAPPVDRVPLPKLKDSDKVEKRKAFKESQNRVPLGKDSLPSVCLYTVLHSNNTVTCAQISEDSTMMALGFLTYKIKVLSLTPSKLREMKTTEQLKQIDIDADDVRERMMDDTTGEDLRVLIGHRGAVYRCSFAPDKYKLLSCSEDATIRLWSLHVWACMVVYKGHLFPVWDVRFSPHGYYFASCSQDKTARVWTTDSDQPLRMFYGHLSDVHCVLFHPNSNYIATGSSDRTVRLWDVLTARMVRLMTGHKSMILSLSFPICGRYLASGSTAGTVIIWDLSQGQLVTTLSKHSGSIHTMSFSRDGNILAMGGLDEHLTLWDFSKLTEDHLAQNISENPVLNDPETYLLRSFPTKQSPFVALHFTLRNLLLGVAFSKQ